MVLTLINAWIAYKCKKSKMEKSILHIIRKFAA